MISRAYPLVLGLLHFLDPRNGLVVVGSAMTGPFLSHSTAGGVTLSLNTETTANWEADGTDRWTVPVNF